MEILMHIVAVVGGCMGGVLLIGFVLAADIFWLAGAFDPQPEE